MGQNPFGSIAMAWLKTELTISAGSQMQSYYMQLYYMVLYCIIQLGITIAHIIGQI